MWWMEKKAYYALSTVKTGVINGISSTQTTSGVGRTWDWDDVDSRG